MLAKRSEDKVVRCEMWNEDRDDSQVWIKRNEKLIFRK